MKNLGKKEKNKIGYFYRVKTKKTLWILLWIFCVMPIILELFVDRHSYFEHQSVYSIDGKFAFYAILGFLACSGLILVAKLLDVFLKVKEDYYDNE